VLAVPLPSRLQGGHGRDAVRVHPAASLGARGLGVDRPRRCRSARDRAGPRLHLRRHVRARLPYALRHERDALAGGRRRALARAVSRAHRGRKEAVMSIRVQQQPPYHVAYMRYVGPFGPRGIPELWDRLMRWAEAHGVVENDKLGIAYDDPAITPPDKLRYDACVVVPPGFAADRLVALMDVSGSTYAVASFVGTAHQ